MVVVLGLVAFVFVFFSLCFDKVEEDKGPSSLIPSSCTTAENQKERETDGEEKGGDLRQTWVT
jgi:hypothetical protein